MTDRRREGFDSVEALRAAMVRTGELQAPTDPDTFAAAQGRADGQSVGAFYRAMVASGMPPEIAGACAQQYTVTMLWTRAAASHSE